MASNPQPQMVVLDQFNPSSAAPGNVGGLADPNAMGGLLPPGLAKAQQGMPQGVQGGVHAQYASQQGGVAQQMHQQQMQQQPPQVQGQAGMVVPPQFAQPQMQHLSVQQGSFQGLQGLGVHGQGQPSPHQQGQQQQQQQQRFFQGGPPSQAVDRHSPIQLHPTGLAVPRPHVGPPLPQMNLGFLQHGLQHSVTGVQQGIPPGMQQGVQQGMHQGMQQQQQQQQQQHVQRSIHQVQPQAQQQAQPLTRQAPQQQQPPVQPQQMQGQQMQGQQMQGQQMQPQQGFRPTGQQGIFGRPEAETPQRPPAPGQGPPQISLGGPLSLQPPQQQQQQQPQAQQQQLSQLSYHQHQQQPHEAPPPMMFALPQRSDPPQPQGQPPLTSAQHSYLTQVHADSSQPTPPQERSAAAVKPLGNPLAQGPLVVTLQHGALGHIVPAPDPAAEAKAQSPAAMPSQQGPVSVTLPPSNGLGPVALGQPPPPPFAQMQLQPPGTPPTVSLAGTGILHRNQPQAHDDARFAHVAAVVDDDTAPPSKQSAGTAGSQPLDVLASAMQEMPDSDTERDFAPRSAFTDASAGRPFTGRRGGRGGRGGRDGFQGPASRGPPSTGRFSQFTAPATDLGPQSLVSHGAAGDMTPQSMGTALPTCTDALPTRMTLGTAGEPGIRPYQPQVFHPAPARRSPPQDNVDAVPMDRPLKSPGASTNGTAVTPTPRSAVGAGQAAFARLGGGLDHLQDGAPGIADRDDNDDRPEPPSFPFATPGFRGGRGRGGRGGWRGKDQRHDDDGDAPRGDYGRGGGMGYRRFDRGDFDRDGDRGDDNGGFQRRDGGGYRGGYNRRNYDRDGDDGGQRRYRGGDGDEDSGGRSYNNRGSRRPQQCYDAQARFANNDSDDDYGDARGDRDGPDDALVQARQAAMPSLPGNSANQEEKEEASSSPLPVSFSAIAASQPNVQPRHRMATRSTAPQPPPGPPPAPTPPADAAERDAAFPVQRQRRIDEADEADHWQVAVAFRCRVGTFYSPGFVPRLGEHVVVEYVTGGIDVGRVTDVSPVTAQAKKQPLVVRVASAAEVDHLEVLRQRAKAVHEFLLADPATKAQTAGQSGQQLKDLAFLDCEYQYDASKLYVYYSAQREATFSKLAQRLHSFYRCFVWMHRVQPAESPLGDDRNALNIRSLCTVVDGEAEAEVEVAAPKPAAPARRTEAQPPKQAAWKIREAYLREMILGRSEPREGDLPTPLPAAEPPVVEEAPVPASPVTAEPPTDDAPTPPSPAPPADPTPVELDFGSAPDAVAMPRRYLDAAATTGTTRRRYMRS